MKGDNIMGLNPELRSVTIRVSYREIGGFAEAKLKEMFPEVEFTIEDVMDDEDGIYFEYMVKGLEADDDIAPKVDGDIVFLDDAEVRHERIPESAESWEAESDMDDTPTV